jgi:hypothetical protein
MSRTEGAKGSGDGAEEVRLSLERSPSGLGAEVGEENFRFGGTARKTAVPRGFRNRGSVPRPGFGAAAERRSGARGGTRPSRVEKIKKVSIKTDQSRFLRYLRMKTGVKRGHFHVKGNPRMGTRRLTADHSDCAEEVWGEHRPEMRARCFHNVSRLKKGTPHLWWFSGVNKSPAPTGPVFTHAPSQAARLSMLKEGKRQDPKKAKENTRGTGYRMRPF